MWRANVLIIHSENKASKMHPIQYTWICMKYVWIPMNNNESKVLRGIVLVTFHVIASGLS